MRGPTPTFFTRCSDGGPLRTSFRFIVKWSGKNRLPHWICQRTENFPRSRKIGVSARNFRRSSVLRNSPIS